MSIKLIVLLSILFVIAMGFTFFAFKQEEAKMKKYKEEGNTVADELRRSREYESTSVKKYIPIQLWIYGIFTILTIIALAIYLY